MTTNRIWRGDALDDCQVTRVSFGEIRAGDVIRLIINNKTIEVTADSASVGDLINRFVEEITNHEAAEWQEVIASAGGSDPYNPSLLELKAARCGRPFIVTVSSGSVRNEKQTILIGNNPTGGTFTLTFQAETTAGIAYDASAADLESALEGLPGVNAGDVSVTGGPLPDKTIIVEFTGQFSDTDVPLMSADAGGLTGGDAQVKVSTIQQGAPQQNEIQEFELFGSPTGGDFRIDFGGQVTGPIAFNADYRAVRDALEALANIQAGDLTVKGGTLPDTGTKTNEKQDVSVTGATTGDFTLSFDGETTGAIAHNADAATVQSALEGLSTIGAGNVSATGGPLGTAAVTVEFIGDLAATDVPELTVTNNTDGTVSVTTAVEGDGPMSIEFGGSLAQTDVAEIILDVSGLTGGSISASVSTTQDGAPGRDEVQFFTITPVDIIDHTTESKNEIHHITGDAGVTGGTWDLTLFPGGGSIPQQVLTGLDHDISPERLLSLIEATSSIAPGQVSLYSSPQDQRLHEGAIYAIEWIGDPIGGTNVVEPTVDNTNLTGGTYTPSTAREGFEVLSHHMGGHYRFVNESGDQTDILSIVATESEVASAIAALQGISLSDVSVQIVGTANVATSRAIGIKVTYSTGQNVPKMGADGTLLSEARIQLVGWIEGGVGGSNEIQRISVSGSPAQGDFELTFEGRTATIPYNASSSQVDSLLEALASIGSGNLSTSGGPLPAAAVDVEFIGDLKLKNVSEMTVNDDGLQSRVDTVQTGADRDQNEIQRLTVSDPRSDVHDGTFTLDFDGQTTAAIQWNASASDMETALEALSNLSDVVVSGGPFPGNDMDVEFRGTEAATDVAEITVASSLDSGTVTVETEQPGETPASVSEHVRSRGSNHYDDPLNWTGLRVPESGDTIWVDGGTPILYGLKQRAEFTADPGTNALTMTDPTRPADFREGQKVRTVSTGTLPSPLSAGTDYHVLNLDRDNGTLQLAASEGGPAIDLTDAGSGTHTVRVEIKAIHVTDAFTEQIGLPVINEDGDYYEYRQRALQIDLDPNGLKEVIVGGPEGAGPGLARFDFGGSGVGSEVDNLRIRSTGGSIEPGRPAVTAVGDALTKITVIAGHFGLAVFPAESAVVTELIVRGGEVEVGKGVTLTTLDKTGGLLQVDEATLNGTAIIE